MLGNKLRELRARRAAGETGFTLVELLVVVVIIVALAAIAVPIFLNQKDKADAAADTSDLASAAKFISAGIADGSLSPATVAATTIPALTSSSGSFTATGMTGTITTNAFCVQKDGSAVSNTSGGVKKPTAAGAGTAGWECAGDGGLVVTAKNA